MITLKLLILSAAISIALGLWFATLPRRGGEGIGRQCPPPADPYFYPFGDMPGFTREQLEEIARRPVELHHKFTPAVTATPAGPSSGGVSRLPHAAAAASERHFEWRRRRAF